MQNERKIRKGCDWMIDIAHAKQEFEKYELISLGVPKIVRDYVNNVVKPKKVKSKELAVSRRAFNAGVIACDKYNGR